MSGFDDMPPMPTFSMVLGLAAYQTVPQILNCPECKARHIDEGDFAEKPHHTHACQSCGFVWRPAVVNTHGVQFLPGFKNYD